MTRMMGMALLVPRALRAAGLRMRLIGGPVLALSLSAGLTLSGCAPPDAPAAVMADGKISEVRNCPPSDAKYEVECLRLVCEKVLYERGTIPAGARVIAAQGRYGMSDMPGKTWHQVKFSQADGYGYAECEMQGRDVVAAHGLRARDQKW